MAKPVLLHSSEIWGFEVSDIIENVQNQFYKRFLKLPVHTFHAFARHVGDTQFTLIIFVDVLNTGLD